jgi:alpha-tubulin suppressor-like RCC1 family protein
MQINILGSLVLAALLAACSTTPPPAANPGNTPTAIDSFGANPNPSPINVGVSFSWTVTGSNLTCTLDAEGDGKVDYTVQDCTSQSRVVHTYGAQGAFTARLAVSGADGQSKTQVTPVTVGAANLPPTIPTLQPQLVTTGDPLEVTFVWSVDDRNSDITHCQFDADSDGVLDYDNLCSGLPTTNAVKPSATVNHFVKYKYPRKGNYTATLEASDPYSSTISAVKVRVPLNSMPVINTLSATAGPNNTASLAFRVSDPDDDPLSCKLTVESIGSFNYPNCRNLTRSFTFGNPGKYRATLEVSDGLQTASKTAVIDLSSPAPIIVKLANSERHNCVLLQDGTAWCWGRNSDGQLGIGVTYPPNNSVITMPTRVVDTGLPGSGFVDLEGGEYHTCGLRSDGSAWCWGKNNFGQLGNNDTTSTNLPVAVATAQRFTAIAAGKNGTCALNLSGAIWCWGKNDVNQLGVPSPESSSVPVAVDTTNINSGTRFTAVSAGADHTCGLRDDGSIWCWGGNYWGQLGDGNTLGNGVGSPPVKVAGSPTGSGWTQVSAGYYFTCGLRDDNSGWCWGGNGLGNLGTGDQNGKLLPTKVVGSDDFTALSAMYQHTCGIRAGGVAYCWGGNGYLKLGNGELDQNSNKASPFPVLTDGVSGTGFTQIMAGYEHTCGLRNDNSVWCWGNWHYGILGNGSTANSPVPVRVLFPW